jgi:hypothetical protein
MIFTKFVMAAILKYIGESMPQFSLQTAVFLSISFSSTDPAFMSTHGRLPMWLYASPYMWLIGGGFTKISRAVDPLLLKVSNN